MLVEPFPSRSSPVAGDGLHVEQIGIATAFEPAWRDLIHRAAEPNVFLHPAFCVPALHHLYPRNVRLIVVRDATQRLMGLMPLAVPAAGRGRLARVLVHAQATLGAPLIDRGAARQVWAALTIWLARTHPHVVALLVPQLAQDGPTFGHLHDAATDAGGTLTLLDAHARAVLPQGGHAATPTAKKAKDLRRLQRRLADGGHVSYVSAETPAAVAGATESFLTLEGRGWKGARRTAFVSRPKRAAFARAVTRGLAEDGCCRIDALCRDGTPVAMGIVLRSGGSAAFWKTAYDERLAALSPGVQFALQLTGRQLADPAVTMTDSCAIADHPMIDRLWPARMTIVDVILPLRPASDGRLARVLRREAARRMLRRRLKALAARLRARLGRYIGR